VGRECDRAELHAVSSAVLAVTAHRSVREVLQTIVTSARRLLESQYAALGVPDEAGSFAEFVADGVSAAQWRAIGPVPRQHGLLSVLLRDPAPLRLANVRRHPDFEGWPDAHPWLTEFLGMPIVDGRQILGAIILANKRGGFTERDEDLLRLLAGHAALALVNARLFERSRELSIVEERNRIARELHDAVSQKLFSLRLTAEAAVTHLARDPAAAAADLDTVRRLAADAAEELGAIVVGLRPADLAGDGLDLALRKQTELLDRVHSASIRFSGTAVPRLGAGREQSLYRIAQEALHNAVRHAQPGRVEVKLAARNGSVVLEVVDDGLGFDPEATDEAAAARRLGLDSMRERARAAGGRLTVRSRRGGGTTVRVEVPAGG
jgi:signal transduction histidine kinase